MISIEARSIPHDQHRYDTAGDWTIDAHGTRHFRVSEMRNADYEFLVLLHEMIEQHLCAKRNISEGVVDAFDQNFEQERLDGRHCVDDDPGDAPDAPYGREHRFALRMEQLMAREIGVDWKRYNEALSEL